MRFWRHCVYTSLEYTLWTTINRMANLSKLKVGVDVPWVTSWSTELIEGAGPCPSVDYQLAILQTESAGYGRPVYSENHVRRQRVMVRGMLCPMCGNPTQEGDRWMQTGTRQAAGIMRRRGLGVAIPESISDDQVVFNAGSIAPSHLDCAMRALDHCPHLGGMSSRELHAFPRHWTIYPLMVKPEPLPGLRVLARPPPASPPAIMFLQLTGITNDRLLDWRGPLTCYRA